MIRKQSFQSRNNSILRSELGFTLMELLAVVAILGIVTAMIFSVYSGFIKHAVSERKTAKTELDLINVYWPLTKEIESAGFGLASAATTTTACIQLNAISISGSEITIHSTAAGDDALAGAWSYVTGASCATGITATAPNNNVLLLGSLDKDYIRRTTVDASGDIADCTTDDEGMLAYWIPAQSNAHLECYETKYSLRDYTSDDPKPATCAPDTRKLSRSTARTTTPDFQPILDCVRALDYRFGCIDSHGSLVWQEGSNCGASHKLRLIKVGLLVQSSTRQASQSPADITLFGDLSPSLRETITLTNEQRYYRWKKREQTITLRNLE